MTTRKRALLEPTDDWRQLQFQLDWTEQTRYELIHPVVVYGRSPVERSQQTGLSARTIYRKVERFDQLGMQSRFESRRLPTRSGACRSRSEVRSSNSRLSTHRFGPTSWPRSASSASIADPVHTRSRRSWLRRRHPPRSSDVSCPMPRSLILSSGAA